MASFKEKAGYGLGDMSTSMFWKIFSFYLPIFYSDIFGLPLASAAVLMLVTRIWDAVSDPIMGIIADRTHSRNGRYRPWLLWMAVPFAVAGCLLFTTPDFGPTGKLVWAYVTYILMMTVYTSVNVPYSSMLAVLTPNSQEKTVFSSYRMFFAYTGSFIALFAWEPLCKFLGGGENSVASEQLGWQGAMMTLGLVCIFLFTACYRLTRERVQEVAVSSSVWADFKSLLHNRPWWILTGLALCINLFNTVRGGVIAYYFKYYIGEGAMIQLFDFPFLFYAGIFLAIGEVCNMIGVTLAVPVSTRLGKRLTMIAASLTLSVLSIFFFYIPATSGGFMVMLELQVAISVLTGIMSPLVWSMYADVADYTTETEGISSTALIFSSGSMSQKFGGAVAGWGVITLLDVFGLVPNSVSQSTSALLGLRLMMSWIPALIALLMATVAFYYPLGRRIPNPIPALTTLIIILFGFAPTASAVDAIDYANYARYAADNAALSPDTTATRVVLMGNSITDFWPERGPEMFEEHPEIIGRGIAGQTSWQFLLRFRSDVIELNPTVVVINYGTNDIAENSGTYDEDTTFGNIRSMVDIAHANGIKVVLASCLPAEGFSWRPTVTDAMVKIRSLNERVKAFAENEGIPYVDYFNALVNENGTAMDSRYSGEKPAVHPNHNGYAVMAKILISCLKDNL